MNKTLYFFTASFPFGIGETFIENEIDILCSNFKKVYIIPNNFSHDVIRDIPSNAQVVNVNSFIKRFTLMMYLKFIFGLIRFSLNNLSHSFNSVNSIRYTYAYNKQLYSKIWNLKEVIKLSKVKDSIYYTYWFEDWATVLSELKRKKNIDSFVSRAHGFDIYYERREKMIIPFRNFQLEMVDVVYCASKASMNYLVNMHPQYRSKINFSHLGVNDNGVNPFIVMDEYTIVSCSNINNIKRVHLIPKILKQLNYPIKWIHFGDGNYMELLDQEINLNSNNLTIELRGRVSNQELLRFYKFNSINAFIHLSISEGGVPVSIQEAASFGIPIIATNAGGTSEIVVNDTGLLLEKEFNIKSAINAINVFLEEKSIDMNYRMGVRKFWQENFNAVNNYREFVKILMN